MNWGQWATNSSKGWISQSGLHWCCTRTNSGTYWRHLADAGNRSARRSNPGISDSLANRALYLAPFTKRSGNSSPIWQAYLDLHFTVFRVRNLTLNHWFSSRHAARPAEFQVGFMSDPIGPGLAARQLCHQNLSAIYRDAEDFLSQNSDVIAGIASCRRGYYHRIRRLTWKRSAQSRAIDFNEFHIRAA